MRRCNRCIGIKSAAFNISFVGQTDFSLHIFAGHACETSLTVPKEPKTKYLSNNNWGRLDSWIYRQRKGCCVNLERNIKEWKNILRSHNGHYISVTIGHSLGSFEPDRKWSWWVWAEPWESAMIMVPASPANPAIYNSYIELVWYNLVWCGAVGQKLFLKRRTVVKDFYFRLFGKA